MNPLQNWNRCFFLWAFCCFCLLLLTFANPFRNHSCILNNNNFKAILDKNIMYSLAREARLHDMDTDNRFLGQYLFNNITRLEHCYIMKRTMEIVHDNVLAKLTMQSFKIEHVANFLRKLNEELNGCKPLGDETHIERNLKIMKDKLDRLGDQGKNKMVGELDWLYDYLKNACTKTPKKTNSGHNSNKK